MQNDRSNQNHRLAEWLYISKQNNNLWFLQIFFFLNKVRIKYFLILNYGLNPGKYSLSQRSLLRLNKIDFIYPRVLFWQLSVSEFEAKSRSSHNVCINGRKSDNLQKYFDFIQRKQIMHLSRSESVYFTYCINTYFNELINGHLISKS